MLTHHPMEPKDAFFSPCTELSGRYTKFLIHNFLIVLLSLPFTMVLGYIRVILLKPAPKLLKMSTQEGRVQGGDYWTSG